MRLYEPTEITDQELFRQVHLEKQRERLERIVGMPYSEIQKTLIFVRKAAGKPVGKWNEGITLSDLPLPIRMFLKASEGRFDRLDIEASRSPARAVKRWHDKGQEFVDAWQQEWVDRMKAEQAARAEVQKKKAAADEEARKRAEDALARHEAKERAEEEAKADTVATTPEEGRRKVAVKVSPPVEEQKPSDKAVAEKPEEADQPDGLFIRGEDDIDPGIEMPATVDDLLAAVDDEPPFADDEILASSDVPPLTIDELTEAMEAGGSAEDFLPPFGEDSDAGEGDTGSGDPEIIEGEEIVGADEIEGIQSDFDDRD